MTWTKTIRKKRDFFWATSVSAKFFCSFSEANQVIKPHWRWSSLWWKLMLPTVMFCNKDLHLSCGRVPRSASVFFLSSMETRLNGCLTTCHPEWLLRKTINSSFLYRLALLMPTLAHWPRDSLNYHVLRALT